MEWQRWGAAPRRKLRPWAPPGTRPAFLGTRRVCNEEQPQHLIEILQEKDGKHRERAKDAEASQSGEGSPDTPRHGIVRLPGSAVVENVGPGLFAQDKEHKHVHETKP